MLTKENKKQDSIEMTENMVSTFAVTFMFSTVVATNPAATCDHNIENLLLCSWLSFLSRLRKYSLSRR